MLRRKWLFTVRRRNSTAPACNSFFSAKNSLAQRARKRYLLKDIADMKITDVLRAEHAVFHNLFDHIETVLPHLKTLAEVKALATVAEKLLQPHSKTEDDLFIEPLEHYFEQIGQNDLFHEEHKQIDALLAKIQAARDLPAAKKFLQGAVAACRSHFDKEERIVFPMAESVLKIKTLAELGEAWLRRREVEK
jgi:hemerythrin-like domain-containing protein